MTSTETTPIDNAAEALYAWSMFGMDGGYPAAIDASIPGYVVMADNDGGEPRLRIYTAEKLLAWHHRALAYMNGGTEGLAEGEEPDDDLGRAMNETSHDDDEVG